MTTELTITQRGTIRSRVFGAKVPSQFDAQLLVDAMTEAVKALPPGAEPGPTKVNFGHWQLRDDSATWFCEVSMDFIFSGSEADRREAIDAAAARARSAAR